MRGNDMISNNFVIDWDKVAVEHTQELIQKDLLLEID